MRCELLGYSFDVPDWLRPDSGLSEIPSVSAHAAMRALQVAVHLGWEKQHIRKRLQSLLGNDDFDICSAGQGGRYGDPLLHAAVRLKDKELVKQLLDRGACWKERNLNHQTALDLIEPGSMHAMPHRLIGFCDSPALPNSAICASSFDASNEDDSVADEMAEDNFHADYNRTRLDCTGPCYKAQDNSVRQWLQYDFPAAVRIIAVQTLGDSMSHERVEAYRMEYLDEWSGAFRPYRNDSNYKCTANIERQFMHENRVVPMHTTRLRILPETWVGQLALRVDVLGFDAEEFENITDEEAQQTLLQSCE